MPDTTDAIGEEDSTTIYIGEEIYDTTHAIGEEGGDTTHAVGEEGGETTLAEGEEGSSAQSVVTTNPFGSF